MTGEASWPLQQAVYARLSQDSALTDMVTGIFDSPPLKPVFPFLMLDGGNSRDWSGVGFSGQEHRLLLHVWSDAPGQAQVKAVMDRIYALLHDRTLNLTAHRLVNMRFEFAQLLHEREPPLRHAVMRFRVITHALI